MKSKLLPVLVIASGLLLISGCSKKQQPKSPPPPTTQPAEVRTKPAIDPEVLAMAQKLQTTLTQAAQSENLNSSKNKK